MSNRTADELIKRFLDIRDHLETQNKAFQEWVKPFKTEMDEITAELHEKLLELGGEPAAR